MARRPAVCWRASKTIWPDSWSLVQGCVLELFELGQVVDDGGAGAADNRDPAPPVGLGAT